MRDTFPGCLELRDPGGAIPASDLLLSFRIRRGVVNYEDPNYNVGLPVFMIHGAWSPEPGVSAFPRSENRSRNEGGGVPTTGAEIRDW